jgi:DNA-binding transcriptional ArsR family regulator
MAMSLQQLDRVFGALADPTRRAILARLADGEATVNELVALSNFSQPTISNHLKVLERAGLVSRGKAAQWRPAALTAGPLKEVDAWVERYRAIWERRLDRLDEYLKELQEKEKRHGRKG